MASSGTHAQHVTVEAIIRDILHVSPDHVRAAGGRPRWQIKRPYANQEGQQDKRARNPYQPEVTHPLIMRRSAVGCKTASITVPCRACSSRVHRSFPIEGLALGLSWRTEAIGDAPVQRSDLVHLLSKGGAIPFRYCQRPGAGVRPRFPAGQFKQRMNFLDRKAETSSVMNQDQELDIGVGILPIPIAFPGCSAKQACLLVIADHLRRHARSTGGFADRHACIPRSSHQPRFHLLRSGKALRIVTAPDKSAPPANKA